MTKFPVDFDSPEGNAEDASPEETQNAADSAQQADGQSPMSADDKDDDDLLAEPEVQGQQAQMES